jgi:hypothetical protein
MFVRIFVWSHGWRHGVWNYGLWSFLTRSRHNGSSLIGML